MYIIHRKMGHLEKKYIIYIYIQIDLKTAGALVQNKIMIGFQYKE